MKIITCIIPAFNEAPRIKQVLDSISDHPLISEIIVVDDGSADNTTDIVKTYTNVTLIVHEKNKGKSAALATGITQAHGEYILFLDADLIGISHDDITNLITPINTGVADVSISLRRNSPRPWHWIGLDYISGERVVPRSLLLDKIETMNKLPHFGIEVFMNNAIITHAYRIKVVHWNEVDSMFKYKKYGFLKGIMMDILMMVDIFRTISILQAGRQIISMRRLRV
jgi:glycosyltransferase involved in cell wall biosynthesis